MHAAKAKLIGNWTSLGQSFSRCRPLGRVGDCDANTKGKVDIAT
jgi:hypothetical protein